MSFAEAIKGAQMELAGRPAWEKARRIVLYARILTAELVGTLAAVPFGVRALALHRSLPDASAGQLRQRSSVSILRDVRYGRRPRNVMDIYLPPDITVQQLPPAAPGAGAADTAEGVAVGAAGPAGPAAQLGAAREQPLASGVPVVLFCHGGVWASGAKWHYAPMATRLAQAGIVTAVMQYTLYPEALVPYMVGEVSRALSWTLDHIGGVGGDPNKVSLVGHSAGAHMCTMALLHRALQASRSQGLQAGPSAPAPSPGSGGSTSSNGGAVSAGGSAGSSAPSAGLREAAGSAAAAGSAEEGNPFADPRMPALLVGMAGVYDIAKHFEYEQGRDVHELSTMKRACGGEGGFASQSPAVILERALAREQQGQRPAGKAADQASPAAPQQAQQAAPYYRSFELRGEAIARRIGLERAAPAAIQDKQLQQQQEEQPAAEGLAGERRPAAAPRAASPTLGVAGQYESYLPPAPQEQQEELAASLQQAVAGQPGDGVAGTAVAAGAGGEAEADAIMRLSVRDALRLPPTLLMSSCTDVTVPWFESSEMYWLLHDCGVPAKHLVYTRTGHADFVVGWRPLAALGSAAGAAGEEDLPDFAGDLVRVCSGQVAPQFNRRTG